MSPEEIERAAAAAWPASEVEERGGWLLRASPGLDRARCNGALPLVAEPDVAVVERWYAARGLPARVQVSPLEARGALDARLAAAGWTAATRTDVLVAPVAELALPEQPVAIVGAPAPRWLAAWARAEERDDVDLHRELVFSRFPPGHAAYALAPGGEAVGLAVLSRAGVAVTAEWLGVAPDGGMTSIRRHAAPSAHRAEPLACGLFCMATHREARSRGLARAVLGGLADWARGAGATTMYLQVLTENAPAQRFYARAGFERSHGYLHRTAP